MRESQIQTKIIKRLESEGYYVVRLIKTNKNGIADLLAMRGAEYFFIEVKADKGVLSELQKYRIEEMQSFGIKVLIERGN